MPEVHANPAAASRARASWLCPLVAWLSQFVLALGLRGVATLAEFWLMVAVVQLVLVVAGIYFGLGVLLAGRGAVSATIWWNALFGLTLSGGTILLVGYLLVTGR